MFRALSLGAFGDQEYHLTVVTCEKYPSPLNLMSNFNNYGSNFILKIEPEELYKLISSMQT